MAAHSSIPAWRISRTEEPGGLQSMVAKSRHDCEMQHKHPTAALGRSPSPPTVRHRERGQAGLRLGLLCHSPPSSPWVSYLISLGNNHLTWKMVVILYIFQGSCEDCINPRSPCVVFIPQVNDSFCYYWPSKFFWTRMVAHSTKETIIVSYTSLRITEPSAKAHRVLRIFLQNEMKCFQNLPGNRWAHY